MHETERMRAFQRAGIAMAAVAAVTFIYALTGDARLAFGTTVLALVIVWFILKLEALADRLLRLLFLPVELLWRLLGGGRRR